MAEVGLKMSTNLFYAPRLPQAHQSLTKGLKFILGPVYFGHDGSLSGSAVLTRNDLPFLAGVKAATNDSAIAQDAQTLIDTIEQYSEIDIWLEG